jgi:hypothetical protein
MTEQAFDRRKTSRSPCSRRLATTKCADGSRTVALSGNPHRARSPLDHLAAPPHDGRREAADSLVALAVVAHDCGDDPGAQSLLREALSIERNLLTRENSRCSWRVRKVDLALSSPVAAARLWGGRRLRGVWFRRDACGGPPRA